MKTPRGARRTDTRLSDGRELIYYDPADAPAGCRSRTPADCPPRNRRSSCGPTR